MKFEKDKFIWNQVICKHRIYECEKKKKKVEVEIYLGLQQ